MNNLNTSLQRISYLQKNKPFLIIDADTYLTDMEHLQESIAARLNSTPDYYHGRPIGHRELLAEMLKEAGYVTGGFGKW